MCLDLCPHSPSLVLMPMVSLLQVSEVLSEELTRLSISGWFHGPSLARPPTYFEPPVPRSPHIPQDVSINYWKSYFLCYTHISRFSDFTWEDVRTGMYFAALPIKPRASQTLTKHSSNELYTQPVFLILRLGFASAETRLGTFTFLRQILIMFLA